MAKFHGIIGYATQEETSQGVYEEIFTEREYFGDMLRRSRRLQTSDKVNDDITISNEISIVSDPFARDNYFDMRYVIYRNRKWKVTNVEEQYPRLLLTLGGEYNG